MWNLETKIRTEPAVLLGYGRIPNKWGSGDRTPDRAGGFQWVGDVESRSDQELEAERGAQNQRNFPEALRSSKKDRELSVLRHHTCFFLPPTPLDVSFAPTAANKSVKEQQFNQVKLKIGLDLFNGS